jgi:phage shock protein PspC (stress-responsive transcriptional regulator)
VEKKVYRSKQNRMIAGVCGGIAAYLDTDPTLVRIAWAILCASLTGIVAYVICALLIPSEP